LWINFARILEYIVQIAQSTLNALQKAPFVTKITFILQIIVKHETTKNLILLFKKILFFLFFEKIKF